MVPLETMLLPMSLSYVLLVMCGLSWPCTIVRKHLLGEVCNKEEFSSCQQQYLKSSCSTIIIKLKMKILLI